MLKVLRLKEYLELNPSILLEIETAAPNQLHLATLVMISTIPHDCCRTLL